MKRNKTTNAARMGLLGRLPHKSLQFRAICLGGVVLVATAAILPLGWAITGNRMGIFTGATAAGACLLGTWIALFLSEPLRRPQYMLALVLVGMMIRMGIPLAAALIVFFLGGPLADAGFLYYLVVFYAVTLSVEIYLSMPHCERD